MPVAVKKGFFKTVLTWTTMFITYTLYMYVWTCTWTDSLWTFPTLDVLNRLHKIITEQEHSFNPVGYSANTRSW